MPNQLNELERRVLDYLVEYLRTNTYQPSIREIGREFSIKSTKTVSELLQSLADKGWIERDPSRSRGVRLLGVEMRERTVSRARVRLRGRPHLRSHPARSQDRTVPRRVPGPMTGDHLQEDGVRRATC
jgi:SOS-response transcriptional repressor LexA